MICPPGGGGGGGQLARSVTETPGRLGGRYGGGGWGAFPKRIWNFMFVAILILLILFSAECARSRWSAVFLWIDLHINFLVHITFRYNIQI